MPATSLNLLYFIDRTATAECLNVRCPIGAVYMFLASFSSTMHARLSNAAGVVHLHLNVEYMHDDGAFNQLDSMRACLDQVD